MSAKSKKHKANLTLVATIRKIHIEELSDDVRGCSSSHPLWQFSHASNTPHQIAALRRVVQLLRDGGSTVPTALSVDILVTTYLDTSPKHPLKRALASSLQSLTSCDVAVAESLERHLVDVCDTTQDSLTSRRKSIDNLASLTENFQLGEQSLMAQSVTVLQFLESSLATFIKNVKSSRDPASRPELMYHCLVTVQMTNKLLRKICDDDGRSARRDGDEGLSPVCRDYVRDLHDILTDETWLLDCRASCGLGVPLVCKLVGRSSTPKVLHYILLRDTSSTTCDTDSSTQDCGSATRDASLSTQDDPCLARSHTDWAKLSPDSYTCVLCGMLAMLDDDDLLQTCYHDNTSLLLTYIAGELFQNIPRLSGPASKVIASRALTQLTTRACTMLDGVSNDSRLAACFHGDGDLLRLLADYTWMSWEDPIDAVRREAKGIFDATIRCHLKSIHSEASSSAYLETLVTSVLSMSWHTKCKYAPLCCLVSYTGATRLLELEPAMPSVLLQTMAEQTLACYVGELFERLFVSHLQELASLGRGAEGHSDQREHEGRDVGGEKAAVGEEEALHGKAAVGEEEALHRKAAMGEEALQSWHVVWLEPTLHALCTGTAPHRKYIVEHLLPKVLKHSPGSIHYITDRLGVGGDTDSFGTLVTCLKQAKTLGFMKDTTTEVKVGSGVKDKQELGSEVKDVTLWNGIIAVSMLQQALVHHDEQTRLDAYGMLCEDPRMTEVVTNIDLGLIKFFLPFNINNQSPAFRQHVVGLTKKLFVRLKESTRVLVRRHKTGREKSDRLALVQLSYYTDFLRWLCHLIFNHLHPEAAFPGCTTALSLLTTIVHVFGAHDREPGSLEQEFYLVAVWTASHVQTLLECLLDTFEENKVNAFAVLSALPERYLYMQDGTRLSHLLEASLCLASSTRPQDCNTAAYILRIITHQPLLYDVITNTYIDQLDCDAARSWTVKETAAKPRINDIDQVVETDGINRGCRRLLRCCDGDVDNDVSGRRFTVLTLLVRQLDRQVTVARHSLVHAASTQPMYPTMHCIRYLLTDIDLRSVGGSVMWRHLLEGVINMCFQVATVVAPVVTNCSPEGFIPEEFCIADLGGDVLDGTAVNKVSLMPEYLTVCCWRSAKEASLLLGQLIETASVIDPDTAPSGETTGLLSVEQIHAVGEYFINQLLQSRHRGAFELAYAGFVKMTTILWNSSIDELRALPRLWLDSVIVDIKSCHPDSRLCATRRSAGVPFYIQALVSTEPVNSGRVCLKAVIGELLVLARPSLPESDTENTAQVHSVNVLRALYRDTRLADDVFPFISAGMQVAVLGCASKFWVIRNSSSLLFSTLMTRVFGVKRAKDDTGRRNCLTGRVFFNRFPPLYDFFLTQLIEATEAIGVPGRLSLHPSLFPTLMVLGRLLPSVLEGSDSGRPLSRFLPHIIRCAGSPVYKIRVMAACALGPLVAKEGVTAVVRLLFGSIPASDSNRVHGVLLQVQELLRAVSEVNVPGLVDAITCGLESTHRLSTKTNPCFLTKTAYLKVMFSAISHGSSDHSEATEQRRCHLVENLVTTVIGYLNVADINPSSSPGETEFYETITGKLLPFIADERVMCKVGVKVDCGELVARLLSCQLYEVRLQTLDFLLQTVTPSKHGSGIGNDGNIEYDVGECTAGQVTSDSLLIGQDGQVFVKLIVMATGKERHPECLAKVLRILCRHPLSSHGPWTGQQGSWTTLEMLQYVMTLTESLRDEVRCAAVELTGRLMSSLMSSLSTPTQTDAGACLLERWIQLLADSCSTHHSQQLRLCCAAALLHSSSLLCATQLGEIVLPLWSVVMRLLEDEDEDVRRTVATVIERLSCNIPTPFKGLCRGQVQPEMAREVCLATLVHMWRGVAWEGCLRLLLLWILHDLQPAFFTPTNTVRLFDKGEMNTFSDPVTFVDLVASHLTQFLASTVKTPREDATQGHVVSSVLDQPGTCLEETQTDQDQLAEPRRLCILSQECGVLCDSLTSLLDQRVDPQCPFVDASQYREDTVTVYRTLVALRCLSDFTDGKQVVSCLCRKVSVKFTQPGGCHNFLLARALQVL